MGEHKNNSKVKESLGNIGKIITNGKTYGMIQVMGDYGVLALPTPLPPDHTLRASFGLCLDHLLHPVLAAPLAYHQIS